MEERGWITFPDGSRFPIDVELFKKTLTDGKPRVVGAGWMPPSERQAATAEESGAQGRRMADVVCRTCSRRVKRPGKQVPIAGVVETPHGPLFTADLYSREATQLGRDWAGGVNVHPGADLVRELLEFDQPPVALSVHCRRCGRMEVATDDVLNAVIQYRTTSKRVVVEASVP